jgi:hypothetical protein
MILVSALSVDLVQYELYKDASSDVGGKPADNFIMIIG